jgi:hypothetical protein
MSADSIAFTEDVEVEVRMVAAAEEVETTPDA